MHPYLIAVYVGVSVVVIVLLAYVAYRVYNRSSTYSRLATKSNGLTPPRIVLTPSSPGKAAKRLYTPTRTMEKNREREEKLNKQRKRERRKDVMSMWLPKRKDTLPITKTTIVQPMPMEMGQVNQTIPGHPSPLLFLLPSLYVLALVNALNPKISRIKT